MNNINIGINFALSILMKIAITTDKDNLQSLVALDIEHTNYFLIIDTVNKEQYNFIPNMYNKTISGAEVFCSQFLIQQGIEKLICGNYSTQAAQILLLAGIKIEYKSGSQVSELINLITNDDYIKNI